MPQVTQVSSQKKKKDRFNIFLDGKYAFAASAESVLKNNLKTGKILTPDDITKITTKEELAKLTDLAANFLSYRQRSEKEIRDYLIKKIALKEGVKYAEAKENVLIEKVLEKLKKYAYINDEEFAKAWFESRLRAKPKGIRLIKLELKQKGVSDEIIEKVTQRKINQKDLALKALEKKLKIWQKLDKLTLKKKIYQYLAYKGFDFETIAEVFALLVKKR